MRVDRKKLEEEAIKSAHNADKRGKLLELELKSLAKRANVKGTPANAARQAAIDILNRKKIKDIHVGRYRAAEIAAFRATEKAILKEDWKEAELQKRIQLLNHYLYREGEKAVKRVDVILRHQNKFNSPNVRKNIARDYLDQIDTVQENFDFKRSVTQKALRNRKSFMTWLFEQEANGIPVTITEEVKKMIEVSEKRHYKDMTYEELVDVDDLVKNIEHLGRFKQKLIIDKQKREEAEVVAELYKVAKAEHKKWKDNKISFNESKIKEAFELGAKFIAEHEKMEFLFRYMDGEKDNGIWWQTFFNSVADAENAEVIMQEEFTKKLNAIIESRYTVKERKTWFK